MSDQPKPATLRPTAVAVRKDSVPAQAAARARQAQQAPAPPLPNATIIYGIGGSLVSVAGLFLLFHGRWFPALIVFAIGGCLMGFAWHLMGGRTLRR